MKASLQAAMLWLLKLRFAKFGLVGASGTVVNLLVLTLCQEWLFRSIANDKDRLYLSLAAAILLATVNNFSWNRIWTWADRRATTTQDVPLAPVWRLFLQYTVASWLGIALQYGLTLWLAQFVDYRLANVMAIALASISNFVANDRWTFRRKN